MMKRKRPLMCVIVALVACACCFLMQRGVYQWLSAEGARFVSLSGEENTLIYLQQAQKLKGDVLFMGSSLTERLHTCENRATLAIPGSSFTASLSLITDPQQFKPGTVYVLEVNNMFSGFEPNIEKKTKEWRFNFFKDSAHFSVAAKPTALIVSCVYQMISAKESAPIDAFEDITVLPENTHAHADFTESEVQELADVINAINLIKKRGGKVCFVFLPIKEMSKHYRRSLEKGCRLAKYLQIPLLNYQDSEVFKYLQYTDATHLKSSHLGTKRLMKHVASDATRYAVAL